MKTIDFLLLANSRKAMPKEINRPGRCIAGVDLATNEFIRIVSDDEGNALDWVIFKDAKPGSMFNVDLDHKAPTIGAQTENWVIGNGLVRLFGNEEGSEWVRPYVNFRKGPFDDNFNHYYERTYANEKAGRGSICVMTAYNVEIYETVEGEGRKKIDFDYYLPGPLKIKRSIKEMSFTDPFYRYTGINVINEKTGEPEEVLKGQVRLLFPKAYLVISIPGTPKIMESGQKIYYKFVAAVIPINRQ